MRLGLPGPGHGARFVVVLAFHERLCNARVMPNEDLITAKDKAAELGISRSTLTRRVQSGDVVPAFRADGDNGVMLFTPQSPPSVASPAAEGRPSPERVS